jgi:hypothetical protein
MLYVILFCIVAVIYSRRFPARGFFYPEDGSDTFLRNVGSHKIYTAPHPRIRYFSYLVNGFMLLYSLILYYILYIVIV